MDTGAGAKRLVTRLEAANMLGLSVDVIDQLRHSGQLLAKRFGRKILIPVSEVERYAESLPWDEPRK